MALFNLVQDWTDRLPAHIFYLMIGLTLLTSIALLIAGNVGRKEKYNYPNPIPGIPFFGNSFQVPSEGQGPWMTEIAKRTGEM